MKVQAIEGNDVTRFRLTDEEGEPIEGRDLTARVVNTHDGLALESEWEPDAGERRAIANGARVLLYVFGRGHPPVSIGVGNPPEGQGLLALYTGAHLQRALELAYDRLSGDQETPGVVDPAWVDPLSHSRKGCSMEEFTAAFRRALDDTRDPARPVGQPGPETNGADAA